MIKASIALSLAVIGLLWLLIGDSDTVHAQPAAQDVCFARWVWNNTEDPSEPFWEAPFITNITGLIDLRSVPDMSLAGGTAQGYGLFAYDIPMGATGMHCLGGNLDAAMTLVQANTIALILGKPMGSIRARDMRGIIEELLTSDADPTGLTFAKPVRSSRKLGLKINLGGYGTIVDKPFSTSSASFTATLGVRFADYRRLRAAGTPARTLRKWTGYDMLQYYGRTGDEFVSQLVPPEHVGDGWERPATTIGDTFTDTNGTSITAHTATGPGGGYGWSLAAGDAMEIQSNEISTAGNNASNHARANSDLSSDDMHATADIVAIAAVSGRAAGTLIRWDSVATPDETFYRARLRRSGANCHIRISKYESASATQLLDGGTFTCPSFPVTFRFEMDGSDMEVFLNAVSQETLTDTSITGNVRAGIYLQGENPGTESIEDNFEAADLAVAARRIIRIN
jgi:hypothetical protein